MSLADLLERGGERVVSPGPFGALTTYRVGGEARAVVTLASRADLEELGPLVRSSGLAALVVGNGSNLLVADGVVEVVVVRLGEGFTELSVESEGDEVRVRAGGALDLPIGARRLAAQGVAGFEWAVGVPGTFGGAAAINAGGHGSQMAQSVERVHTWSGVDRAWSLADLDYGYRSSALGPEDWVTDVELRLERGDPEVSRQRISEVVRWRRAHQPGGANAGSVFQNPAHDSAGRLIEATGLKGARVGGAVVSERHANFIIAEPGASAQDVYELIRRVRDEVEAKTGVELHLENRLIGFGVDP